MQIVSVYFHQNLSARESSYPAMENQKPIVTITMNPAVDVSVAVNQVTPDLKLRCSQPREEPGGGGINVSRAISRLGGQSRCYYTFGGANGNLFETLIEKEQIPGTSMKVAGLTRQSFTVMEETSGRQYRFTMPGPLLDQKEWESVLKTIESLHPVPSFIVASGSLPPGVPDDFFGRLSKIAKQKDIRCIVDTSGRPLRKAVEAGVFLLKPNMRELQDLLQQQVENEEQQVRAAKQLIGRGKAHMVVLSLGAGGALFVSAEQTAHLRSPSVPIRSKIGAGDSMVAGIVLALARGYPPLEAARYGVACGAAAVMTEGSELCKREDAERLFRELERKNNL